MGEAKKKPGRPRTADRHVRPRRMLHLPADLCVYLERVAELNERPISWEAIRAVRAHLRSECTRLGIPGPPEEG